MDIFAKFSAFIKNSKPDANEGKLPVAVFDEHKHALGWAHWFSTGIDCWATLVALALIGILVQSGTQRSSCPHIPCLTWWRSLENHRAALRRTN